MIGRTRSLALGGASVLAIITASALAPSQAHADCVAVPSTVNDEPVVNVVCATVAEDPVITPFATSYTSSTTTSIGIGNDTLNMTGGVITEGVEGDFVPVSGTDGFLDLSTGVVQMLGGDDIVEISGGQIGSAGAVSLSLGDGADTFVMSGGTLNGSVFGDAGDDEIEVSGSAVIIGVAGVSAAIETGVGDNEVRILSGTVGTDPTQLAIFLEDGANIFEMRGGAVNGTIVGQGGGNTYTIDGGVINGSLFAGSGGDGVTISDDVVMNASPGQDDAIGLDTGDDTFTMTGGTLIGNVSGNAGVDTFDISGGTIAGLLNGNDGADSISISGGAVSEVFGDDGGGGVGAGNDTMLILGGEVLTEVHGNGGADQIQVGSAGTAGPTIGSDVLGEVGDDTLGLLSGSLGGNFDGGDGSDSISVSGGAVGVDVLGGAGDDQFNISGGSIAGSVSGSDGIDTVTISNGSIGANITGGAGNDLFSIGGGTIAGNVSGDDGTDNVTISGGTISGDVIAETVFLFGGTIGGNISGISGNTLIIDDSVVAAPLNLPNGVIFSGDGTAVGTITDTDLARGGAFTQVFTGFDSVYTATGELRWLEEAKRLTDLAVELFGDAQHGGFFFTAADGESLVARKKELVDQPTPSGNSMLALVLLRLSRIYGDGELERRAVGVFRLGHVLADRAPSAVGHLLCALGLHFSLPREVAIVGTGAGADALRGVALRVFAPETVYAFATGADDPAVERVPLLEGKALVGGLAAAYVCERFACRAPVTDPDELRELLEV